MAKAPLLKRTTGSSVVVVESPAKAKTINKYLGDEYVVLASYGHIRDLPPKDGSVRPDEDFAMDWELSERAGKPLGAIAQAMKGADRLFLCTDPDREGEAISWHVAEVLGSRKLLKDVEVQRVTFNEITKAAVQEAFRHPRQVNQELVEAYLARRALDYLVGFTLSPVLWRKLPGSRSAGRVQSVALRLVCERETEIEAFRAREYWSVIAELSAPKGGTFPARLVALDGKKLDKFSLATEAQAREAAARVEAARLHVAGVERRQARRNPSPPFITSTLQQEASRKLGFGATRTMRLAQGLYEGVDIGGETVGLITYMRTDGVQLSQEAIQGARTLIGRDYGAPYVPAQPRVYRSPSKNAQEAHEAIRPTDLERRPEQVVRYLERDAAALYDLIWKRTVAAQMESAVLDQVSVDIADERGTLGLRATGSIVAFDGFLKLYQEDRDEPSGEEDEQNRRLPALAEKDQLGTGKVVPEQHFTQPPPRFSEASLVKELEALGIGRPSTYASILQVLQDREYVRLEKKRFVPEDRGRLVTAFLHNFFARYVEYSFTAELEQKLDAVSDGKADWKALLREFWAAFSAAIGGTKDLKIGEVIDALDQDLAPHLFPPTADGHDPRVCRVCGTGRLSLKLGKFGAFIGCSNYPTCQYTRRLAMPAAGEGDGSGAEAGDAGPRLLGTDPESGLPVTVRKGPYGDYVQLGPAAEGGKTGAEKPKRVSLPKGESPAELALDRALKLLALPREIGVDPNSGQAIQAGIGRYGPYLKVGPRYVNLQAGDDVLEIGLNRAVSLVAEAPGPRAQAAAPLRTLGDHPEGGPVTLHAGRYGPYVKHGKVMATVPKSADPETLTLDQAVPLLAAKAPAKRGGKAPARKAAAAKKAPAKKARAK